MTTPQSAILPEHMTACIVIEADFTDENLNQIKAACTQSLSLLAKYQAIHADAALGLCIGFGDKIWSQLRLPNEGVELKPFRPLGNGLSPAAQHDVAFHIQSNSHAANLALAFALLDAFGASLCVADEIHGFRLHEERGLDGFVDGTENPEGPDRCPIAVISEPFVDAGGSYLFLQKYQHDLKKWTQCSDERQSAIVGRSKASDEELPGSQRLPDSHLGRVDLKEHGVGLKIVRQSLPYGTASGEHGLMFIAYCARLHHIEQQLLSMFGELDGKTDLLLSTVSQAKSGAYYFVPSQERLAAL
ncbi:Dyp-type peroxidase [Stenoxybacter acetivorans]|uniref:Dyp-type peroxidase n=1 Tax=Stenoxybacter acetivorans TaxID=422441 RepID=UPI0005625DA6|nr:Dyp-type peroxidase [Stenoxybacter acetivorans]